jgi:hypothetical protein
MLSLSPSRSSEAGITTSNSMTGLNLVDIRRSMPTSPNKGADDESTAHRSDSSDALRWMGKSSHMSVVKPMGRSGCGEGKELSLLLGKCLAPLPGVALLGLRHNRRI